MEIGNKILELRKKNNITQEELADKVGVSRQTISKWELGETSPDLKQSKELSKIFKVSLDELVDNDIKEIITEKVSNTEELAGLILKLLRIIGLVIAGFAIFIVATGVIKEIRDARNGSRIVEKSIVCTLYDEEYSYGFRFYEETGNILEAGGDGYLANITEVDRVDDAYVAIDKIKAYVADRGGTCEVREDN